mmetsp:Transcript_45269/g.117168  ORF Transcript_45269/g.117168 Transcript_45269/m.117168 type:complete len:93 (+) Transcript_45269:290-568(+)
MPTRFSLTPTSSTNNSTDYLLGLRVQALTTSLAKLGDRERPERRGEREGGGRYIENRESRAEKCLAKLHKATSFFSRRVLKSFSFLSFFYIN